MKKRIVMNRILSVCFVLCMTSQIGCAQSHLANLQVKGESKVFQVPDLVAFTVNISTKDMQYETCVEQNLEDVKRLKTAVNQLKLTSFQLKDVGQRVNEEINYSGGKSHPDGYRANYQLSIEVDAKPAVVHKLLEAMRESGVKMNYSIQYKLSPELVTQVETKLIDAAVADAMKKARQIAQASKCKLLHITNINYGVTHSQVQALRYMDAGSRLKDGREVMESFSSPDSIELTDQVEISFVLSNP